MEIVEDILLRAGGASAKAQRMESSCPSRPQCWVPTVVLPSGAGWQGLEGQAEPSGSDPVGSREPWQVLEQRSRFLKAAVEGAS